MTVRLLNVLAIILLATLAACAPGGQEVAVATAYLDAQGVSRGEIKDLGSGFGIYVMTVRDPDNIQLELTAPYAA